MTDQWQDQGIDSATADTAEYDWFQGPTVPDDPGSIVDGEIVDDKPRGKHNRLRSDTPSMLDRDAKTGMPNIDEWMHFFSKVLIRIATDFYIDHAFRGVDDNALSDREIDLVKLNEVERERIARPFAEYAYKAKFTRKHGRMIIASADSIDAAVQFGMWFSRVNRIAAKYRKPGAQRPARVHVRASPVFQPTEVQPQQGDDDVSTGPNPESNGRGDHWRPDIQGAVFNINPG